jgi:fused signal recognition particle receptor
MIRNEPTPNFPALGLAPAGERLSGQLPAGLLEVRFNDTKSFQARVLALRHCRANSDVFLIKQMMFKFWKKKADGSEVAEKTREPEAENRESPGEPSDRQSHAAQIDAPERREAETTNREPKSGAVDGALNGVESEGRSSAPAFEGTLQNLPLGVVSGELARPSAPLDNPSFDNLTLPTVPHGSGDVGSALADSRFPVPGPSGVPVKRTWRERLAGSILNRDVRTLFARKPKLDDALLDELETLLIGADVGVAASTSLVESLRKRMNKREFADSDDLLRALRADLIALLQPVAQPLRIDATKRPFVVLMVGVNGVGKTTTIGKLARRLQAQKHSVVLAAGDTFRAAAVEQLKTWGDRNRISVVAQGSGADSASVIFDALQWARSRHVDVLIADTAGRLHTQSGLMDELSKIRRVLGKIDAQAPHEVLLVIDGTTGQNAVNQTRQFRAAIGVTGLVVTKLDGSAKGGVVFALAKEFGLPIRFVGLGESIEDLREFEPAAFVDALLPANLGSMESLPSS